jgi:hypothetical protein
MIREKRLSPRRAKSRLPLSPRANSRLRLKPLLFLRPLPLQRRHTKCARLARFCTHYEYPFFDARPEGFRSSVRLWRMSSRPTARLRRKSTVCGLNRYRGRDKGELCPSLRTGLADLLHPALQLVVDFQEDRQAAAYACLKENKPTAEK